MSFESLGFVRDHEREIISVPSRDGSGVSVEKELLVPVWRNPKTGEAFHDEESRAVRDNFKASLLGTLTPDDLLALRSTLKMSQADISMLLQLGEKTWSRWECGREHPSKSLNLLILALKEGRLSVEWLESKLAIPPIETPIFAFLDEPAQAPSFTYSSEQFSRYQPTLMRHESLAA